MTMFMFMVMFMFMFMCMLMYMNMNMNICTHSYWESYVARCADLITPQGKISQSIN